MFRDAITKAKLFLRDKKLAYTFTFQKADRANSAVLRDLAIFCRADKSTFNKDSRAHAVLEGRREVWLRIQNYLQLNPDELWELYRKKEFDNE